MIENNIENNIKNNIKNNIENNIELLQKNDIIEIISNTSDDIIQKKSDSVVSSDDFEDNNISSMDIVGDFFGGEIDNNSEVSSEIFPSENEHLTISNIISHIDSNEDPAFYANFILFINTFYNDLENMSGTNLAIMRQSSIKKYLQEFKILNSVRMLNKRDVIAQLYCVHMFSRSLIKYHEIVWKKYNKIVFRSRVFFPNVIYLLVRFLPICHEFCKKTIKYIYDNISRRYSTVVNKYINNLYYDADVIKSDVLYYFLGNASIKFNPLEVHSHFNFYRSVFKSIFYFKFKSEHNLKSKIADFGNIENGLDSFIYIPVRYNIYKDVLYSLQTKKYINFSPTLSQLYYNYSIFRNIIINNEFQNIYFSKRETAGITNILPEYKLMKVFKEDINNDNLKLMSEIKKLPIIYKLLKSVHIIDSMHSSYDSKIIKPDVVKNVVYDELKSIFRNILFDENYTELLSNISINFTNSILCGEYINLINYNTVRINQVSFIQQVKKFIRLCISF